MNADSLEVFDARLKTPFALAVSGPSNSGKTQFVLSLLSNADVLIDKPFDYIVWFYGENNPVLEALRKYYGVKIKLIKGIPESFDELIFPMKRGCFVFDDLMSEASNLKEMTHLFTRRCHHENLSIIFITQNLFHDGRERKNFTRNLTYLVVFNNPLDRSCVYTLANRIMPKGQKIFLKMFDRAVSAPYSYLFIDGHQSTPSEAKFRTDIFNNVQRVYTINR